jgi:hypothetical protein
MSALNQLKNRANKREEILRKQKKEKEGEERELQRVKKEDPRTTSVIYIEPLASRPPPIFQENSESYGEERDVEHEIFEALKCVAIVEEGFEKTL